MTHSTVEGTRETTSVAAGAYAGIPKQLVITRELWHSPELDLDVVIKKSDPRSRNLFVRKIEEIMSRNEPDPDYFHDPERLHVLGQSPDGKKIGSQRASGAGSPVV